MSFADNEYATVQVYEPVSDYLALREYEDIDNPRPNHISQPNDLRINDYSQTAPNPHDTTIHGYDIPLRVCIFFYL
jgi:hypothetical protein